MVVTVGQATPPAEQVGGSPTLRADLPFSVGTDTYTDTHATIFTHPYPFSQKHFREMNRVNTVFLWRE